MSIPALLSLAALALPQGSPSVKWEPPRTPYIDGTPFVVRVNIQAPRDGAALASWLLEPSAFTIDGKPLAERGESHTVNLAPGTKLTIETDLAPLLSNSPSFERRAFKLGYARGVVESEEVEVGYVQPVEKGLDFMTMPLDDLAKYHVVLRTNKGDIELEFWPDVAPNHVRNFLDLSYTGFYDGKTFHRVIPNFMIQGGDPTGTGGGNSPRKVNAEFSGKKHVAGVLSMARMGDDINSGSCQFFIMHAARPDLDGKYSAFGKLVSGQDVVDKIATAKRGANDKPTEPQVIVKATVTRVAPQ
jgi:peptidyl-prolyl cis-trans isomerase B (cyclophilin B)